MSKNGRILYVEDNIDNQFLLQYYLKKEPYELMVASNGKRAMSLIDEFEFDMFLVDLNLPDGHSGGEIAKYIKQDEKNKDKPIIIVTAFTEQDRDDADMELQVDKFLTKPIRKKDLLDVLHEFLGDV